MQPTSTRSLVPGARLGEWVLEAPLGRGSYAEVWRARHNALPDRRAAVKVPHDAAYAERLRREGIVQLRCHGEHVVSVLGLDPDHDPPYLVMDLVEGCTLRDRLRRGRLDAREAVRLAREVAAGLATAHAHGIVHRDLKPENVLLDADGRAHVSDFGLGLLTARATTELLASGSLQTRSGHDLAGTLRYMAPEQRDPAATVDARADLYALGVVLFETLTGEAPSGGEVPTDVVPDLDPRLDRVFRRLCARLPSRYADAGEVIVDLRAIEREPALEAPPSTTPALRAVRAGLFWRLVAFVLDAAPFLAAGLWQPRPQRLALAAAGLVLYDLLGVALGGRTHGRWLAGLRVARTDGGRPTAGQAVARTAFRLVSLLTLGLGYLPVLGARKQALHDLQADTVVLHDDGAPRGVDRAA